MADAKPGSIVELRLFDDMAGRQRVALAVRSDFPVDKQVGAQGGTWLDRQLVGVSPRPCAKRVGAEVREAMNSRVEHLISEGLSQAPRAARVFARDLLDTLRRRELEVTATRLSAKSGLPYHPLDESELVAGVYRRRLDLFSGRFEQQCRLLRTSAGKANRTVYSVFATVFWSEQAFAI